MERNRKKSNEFCQNSEQLTPFTVSRNLALKPYLIPKLLPIQLNFIVLKKDWFVCTLFGFRHDRKDQHLLWLCM